MDMNRRDTLRIGVFGSAAALAAAGLPAAAQSPQKLSVFGHRVHQTVATGSQGGDITKGFTERTKTAVEWVTFDTGPLWERVLRETSLRETSVDVAFLLNTQITPRAAGLFEPLDPWMAKAPIEDPADVFPGLVSGFKVGGQLVAIAYRHASSGMHYNEEILAERGFSGPPGRMLATMATMEEPASVFSTVAERGASTAAAGLFFVHGDEATWVAGFSTPDGRKEGGHRLVLMAALGELRRLGVARLDLGGVATDDAPGIARFKRGMGGSLVIRPGTWGR